MLSIKPVCFEGHFDVLVDGDEVFESRFSDELVEVLSVDESFPEDAGLGL